VDRKNIVELIEASDLDGLVRLVDGFANMREWSAIQELVERCGEAVERGKQVWGAAHYGEYRLALDAPAEIAATVVVPGAGRFAPGPLWEVAASSHSWDELDAHLSDPTMRSIVAQERALRGDGVPIDAVDVDHIDVPSHPQPWEPVYAGAVYRSDGVDVAGPELGDMLWIDLPERATRLADDPATDALIDLVLPWLEESSGRGEALVVEGSAEEAIRTLGPSRARVKEIELADAMQLMTWTAASGGAYGRRRGTPAGRAAAWWALACLLGMEDDWPVDPKTLGEEGDTLRWLAWEPGDIAGGWSFHMAIEDIDEHLAWAVSAADEK